MDTLVNIYSWYDINGRLLVEALSSYSLVGSFYLPKYLVIQNVKSYLCFPGVPYEIKTDDITYTEVIKKHRHLKKVTT